MTNHKEAKIARLREAIAEEATKAHEEATRAADLREELEYTADCLEEIRREIAEINERRLAKSMSRVVVRCVRGLMPRGRRRTEK